MKLAPCLELYAYWNALRGARGAPERNDIDPGALRGVLADTFILEFCPKAGFPLRVAGSRTSALFARELRGEPFLDLWANEDRSEMIRILEDVADGAQPFLIGAHDGPRGGAALDLEVLLLPLRHHGATHARALGCFAPSANPPWLGLLPMPPLAISSLRALTPKPLLGFNHRNSSVTEVRRRGHLFVYSSGR